MQKVKYIRDGAAIIDAEHGQTVFFGRMKGLPSINQAKKESCKLQRASGGFGCGSLAVKK